MYIIQYTENFVNGMGKKILIVLPVLLTLGVRDILIVGL